jgi:hypothetical protein
LCNGRKYLYNIYYYLARSQNLLKQNNIQPVDNCINICIDSEDHVFKTPNYCINDPFFEKHLEEKEDNHGNIQIDIHLYDLYENKTFNTNISNNISGKELKAKFAELANLNIEEYKLRLLFGGVEIKEENFIYQYKIENGYTVQIMKTKL